MDDSSVASAASEQLPCLLNSSTSQSGTEHNLSVQDVILLLVVGCCNLSVQDVILLLVVGCCNISVRRHIVVGLGLAAKHWGPTVELLSL